MVSELYKEDILKSNYAKFLENISSIKNINNQNIHFISKNIFPYDAVSKCVLDQAILAEKMINKVYIYADGCLEQHRSYIYNREELENYIGDSDIIFYHFSIGDHFLDTILRLPHKKIVYYHGITPPKFLWSYFPDTAEQCKEGLEQLKKLDQFDYIVSNSWYNMNQVFENIPDNIIQKLKSDNKCRCIPPFVFTDKWDFIKEEKPINIGLQSSTKYFLYVGRRYSHKNIEGVIKFFSKLIKKTEYKCRLFLVGNDYSVEYDEEIKYLINQEIQDDKMVSFIKNATDENLKYLYKNADYLINLSYHEGFCIPLIEGMKFNLPILTHRTSAIPETLKDSGIIVNKDDYEKLVDRTLNLMSDNEQKKIVIENQRNSYCTYYSTEKIVEQVSSLIKEIYQN